MTDPAHALTTCKSALFVLSGTLIKRDTLQRQYLR